VLDAKTFFLKLGIFLLLSSLSHKVLLLTFQVIKMYASERQARQLEQQRLQVRQDD